MSDAPFDPQTLSQPLDDAQPAGPLLDYEPPFQALEQAGAGKPERQWGDKIYPAEPPDWPTVQELALPLAGQARDLRVAMWLLRSGTRLRGLAGAVQGLQLLQGLLEGLWDQAHPQLDASDGNDPTERLSALAPLLAPEAVLADLRAAALAPERGSLTLRELELALGKAEPAQDEAQPTEAGVLQALQALTQRHAGLADTLRDAHRHASAIAQLLEQRIGAGRVPDFNPLTRLLAWGPQAVAKLTGDAASTSAANPGAGPDSAAPLAAAPASGVANPGVIRSRDDAVQALERVCHWIEQHEPSNPAPLLIRRAQRLMHLSFLEIIRDLAPDGLNQVEHIAGPQA